MSKDPGHHAFEYYMKGGQPFEVELATAPTLDIWSTEVVKRGGMGVVVLKGIVMKHPTYADCERIVTSPVVWLDRKHRWARTQNTLYVLEGAEILIEGLQL